jgi:hypothetical protein
MGAGAAGGSSGTAGAGQGGQGGAAGDSGVPVPDLSECDVPEPCPEVTEQIGELVIPPTDEALRCVIQALHDRTPGLYFRTTSIAGSPARPGPTQLYLVKGDGSVNTITNPNADPSNPRECSLLPATDYEPCLTSASTDTWATTECRNVAWVTDCIDADVACE